MNILEKYLVKILRWPKRKLFGLAFGSSFALYYIFYVCLQFLNINYYLGTVKIDWNPISAIIDAFSSSSSLLFFGIVFFAGGCLFYQQFCYHKKFDRGYDDDKRFTRAEQATHGSARFMTNEELEEDKDLSWDKWSKTDGIVLGKKNDLPVARKRKSPTDNYNMVIFGSAGAGKSTCFVIPYIWQVIAQGKESIITVDTKGGIYKACVYPAMKAGYQVKVFNLKEPATSQGIDILGEVGIDEERAGSIAQIIFTAGAPKDDSSFWGTAAQMLIKALILAVGEEKLIVEMAQNPGETGVTYDYDPDLIGNTVNGYGTLGRLFDMLTNYEDDAFGDLCKKFERIYAVKSIPHPSRLAWNAFQANASDRVAPGIIQNAAVALSILSSENIRRMVGTPDISLEAPAMEKCLYFVNVDDQDESKRMISTMFFTLLTQKLVRHADNRPDEQVCEVPVSLLIDEFGAVGTIPNFNNTLAGARSRGIRTVMAMQNVEQLVYNYPDRSETILSNCSVWLSYKCNDLSTAKLFSDTIGKTTIVEESNRTDRKVTRMTRYTNSFSETTKNSARPLMLPEEVMSVEEYSLLARFSGDKNPIILKKNFYKDMPQYKRLIDEGWREEDYDIIQHKRHEQELSERFHITPPPTKEEEEENYVSNFEFRIDDSVMDSDRWGF